MFSSSARDWRSAEMSKLGEMVALLEGGGVARTVR